MNTDILLIIISTISIFTGLIVEAIKQIHKSNVYNVIAGIVAVVLSVLTGIGYAACNNVTVDAKYIIFFICVAIGSWLSSMIGFDKVKQAIAQIGGLYNGN